MDDGERGISLAIFTLQTGKLRLREAKNLLKATQSRTDLIGTHSWPSSDILVTHMMTPHRGWLCFSPSNPIAREPKLRSL